MRSVEWITPVSPVSGRIGATASNPARYDDCNLAAPSATGREIIKRLQAVLQREMPGYDVLQTGYLDAETCAAWRDSPTGRMLESFGIPYPTNFNVTNILDKLDGASQGPDGRIRHHWQCASDMISSDCSKSTPRGSGDPCPRGQQRDPETGSCHDIVCGQGQALDPESGECVATAKKKKGKTNWGVALLGAAVVAAGAFALS